MTFFFLTSNQAAWIKFTFNDKDINEKLFFIIYFFTNHFAN